MTTWNDHVPLGTSTSNDHLKGSFGIVKKMTNRLDLGLFCLFADERRPTALEIYSGLAILTRLDLYGSNCMAAIVRQ